jgi:hypothetical protein
MPKPGQPPIVNALVDIGQGIGRGAMGDGHPFGFTSGAGGIDDVEIEETGKIVR